MKNYYSRVAVSGVEFQAISPDDIVKRMSDYMKELYSTTAREDLEKMLELYCMMSMLYQKAAVGKNMYPDSVTSARDYMDAMEYSKDTMTEATAMVNDLFKEHYGSVVNDQFASSIMGEITEGNYSNDDIIPFVKLKMPRKGKKEKHR